MAMYTKKNTHKKTANYEPETNSSSLGGGFYPFGESGSTGKEITIERKANTEQVSIREIKSKREQIPADSFRTSQSPLRRMAHVATRHFSQFGIVL
jgi:hypothetical protein